MATAKFPTTLSDLVGNPVDADSEHSSAGEPLSAGGTVLDQNRFHCCLAPDVFVSLTAHLRGTFLQSETPQKKDVKGGSDESKACVCLGGLGERVRIQGQLSFACRRGWKLEWHLGRSSYSAPRKTLNVSCTSSAPSLCTSSVVGAVLRPLPSKPRPSGMGDNIGRTLDTMHISGMDLCVWG